MSTEEDTELRDLVAQTLEVNGCLPKIRAELRASIFLALDEDGEKQAPLLNTKVKTHLESQDGRIMFCLVREFLEFFDLDFTISVYEPESYLGPGYQYEGKSKIIEDLGISELKENPSLPVLLQLIQIARLKNIAANKNIDINLRKIQGDVEEEPDSNKIETEINSEIVDVSSSKESSVSDGALNPITEIVFKEPNLNETFEVNCPISINLKEKKEEKPKSVDVILNPRSIDSSKTGSDEKDDTYDGTSSIAEDSMKDSPQLDLEKVSPEKSETEFSPPILKDSKLHSKFDISFDKLKLSPQKTEKIKAKTSLSSLADLPPLQLNKSRNDTVLLPSLYSKEFKATNQNLKELDKFFDVDDNYEEDFMSESEINLNSTRNNLLDETSTDSNKNTTESKNSYSGKGLFVPKSDANQNLEKNKNGVRTTSATSSAVSDEINSNVDDILNSPTSN